MAWLPTPYVTLSFGIGGSQIASLTFTTLSHLNSKKYITGGTITQTSKTTVSFELSLVYYPGTFTSGDANDLMVQLNLAMSNEKTRDIFLQFGYYSNSPYTGGAESSPIYKGLITGLTCQVRENYVEYKVKGYGKDLLFGSFALDENIDKLLTENMTVHDYLVKYVLNNGKLAFNGNTLNFDVQLVNISFSNKKMIDIVMANYNTSANLINITNSYAGIPTWVSQEVKTKAYNNARKAVYALRDKEWNKNKQKFVFKNLINGFLDNEDIENITSANIGKMGSKTEYSVFEVVELFSRVLNALPTSINCDLRCFVEPYSNGSSYDGTIIIYDANKPLSSKRNFFWGRWSSTAGVLSNKNTVVSWACDYNALAKLYKGSNTEVSSLEEAEKNLYNNVNTELDVQISPNGDIIYNLISSQTENVSSTDYRTATAQNIQYGMQLTALQKIFDYPYKATIEVLGICDAWQIARTIIRVYVYVNGVPHFTTGEYLILGYRHNVGTAKFTTVYDLIKIPKEVAARNKFMGIINDLEKANELTVANVITKYYSTGGSS